MNNNEQYTKEQKLLIERLLNEAYEHGDRDDFDMELNFPEDVVNKFNNISPELLMPPYNPNEFRVMSKSFYSKIIKENATDEKFYEIAKKVLIENSEKCADEIANKLKTDRDQIRCFYFRMLNGKIVETKHEQAAYIHYIVFDRELNSRELYKVREVFASYGYFLSSILDTCYDKEFHRAVVRYQFEPYCWEGERVAVGEYLYHFTASERENFIKQNGLLMFNNSKNYSYPKRIFFFLKDFTNKYVYEGLVLTAFSRAKAGRKLPDILRIIDLPIYGVKTKNIQFYYDPNYRKYGCAVYCYSNIPSSSINWFNKKYLIGYTKSKTIKLDDKHNDNI